MKAKKPLNAILVWVGRVLLAALIFFLGLLAFLLIRESIVRSRYRAEYPLPGKTVSLDTHDLHLTPTQLFQADHGFDQRSFAASSLGDLLASFFNS